MAKKKPRRRYTDDERANAVAAVAANGGNVNHTANQLGIEESTLRKWVTGQRRPNVPELAEQKKGELADEAERVAWALAAGIGSPEKIEKTPLDKLAVAFGIMVDKVRLLRDKPTSITKTERPEDDLSDLTDDQLRERKAQALERLRALGVGAAPAGGGPDRPAGDAPAERTGPA